MRLDKFLKVSRLIKRRTVAADVCESSHVKINGNFAKPGKTIREGDIITIIYQNKEVKAKILKVPEGNVSINEAHLLYEIIE